MHPCNCDKRIEQHQRDLIKNCWEEIALKTGLKNGESLLFVVACCLKLPFCKK